MTAALSDLFPPDFPADFPAGFPSDNDALARELTSLAGHINAANYRFLQLLARFDAQDGWCGAGIRSCAHWLEWQCGIGLGAAREKLRVARALESLPKIASAFARGELSYCMVRALTRKASPANEDYYLMIARHGTVSHVERLVRLHDHAEKLQEADHEARQYECREASCYQDDNGNWVIRATLPPEAGELVVKALHAIIDSSEHESGPGVGWLERSADQLLSNGATSVSELQDHATLTIRVEADVEHRKRRAEDQAHRALRSSVRLSRRDRHPE